MNAMTRVRNRFFLGSLAIGGFSGFWKSFPHVMNKTMVIDIFTGIIFVALACFIGGFIGLFGKNIFLAMRGKKPDHEYDMSYGIIICSFFGAFLGAIIAFSLGDKSSTPMGAAIGAFVGGTLGGIPGEYFPIVLSILLENETSV